MHLADVEVQGVSFPVEVDERGQFSTTFREEVYEEPSLATLRSHLADAVVADRLAVPFQESKSGRRGTLRGWHAGNRDVLVTWDDGEKGRVSPQAKVVRVTDENDEELGQRAALQRDLLTQRDAVLDQLVALSEGGEPASEVLAQELGEDLTEFRRAEAGATA